MSKEFAYKPGGQLCIKPKNYHVYLVKLTTFVFIGKKYLHNKNKDEIYKNAISTKRSRGF